MIPHGHIVSFSIRLNKPGATSLLMKRQCENFHINVSPKTQVPIKFFKKNLSGQSIFKRHNFKTQPPHFAKIARNYKLCQKKTMVQDLTCQISQHVAMS